MNSVTIVQPREKYSTVTIMVIVPLAHADFDFEL